VYFDANNPANAALKGANTFLLILLVFFLLVTLALAVVFFLGQIGELTKLLRNEDEKIRGKYFEGYYYFIDNAGNYLQTDSRKGHLVFGDISTAIALDDMDSVITMAEQLGIPVESGFMSK